jgi:hypothetical protein
VAWSVIYVEVFARWVDESEYEMLIILKSIDWLSLTRRYPAVVGKNLSTCESATMTEPTTVLFSHFDAQTSTRAEARP